MTREQRWSAANDCLSDYEILVSLLVRLFSWPARTSRAKCHKKCHLPLATMPNARITNTKSGSFISPYKPARLLSSTTKPRAHAMLGT